MPLFKITEDIQKYISVNISTSIENVLPDIIQAEEEYIKKYLGTEQYEALLEAYTAATEEAPLSAPLEKLLSKVQLPLINLAYASYIHINQVQISDAGVRIATEGSMKTAFQWQIQGVVDSFNKKGFNGLESLLSFLEENKEDYPLWTDSDAYSEFKKYFINSAKEFDGFYKINKSRLTFLSLESIMKKVEDFAIKPALGAALFKEIKDKIKEGTALSADEKELMEFIAPAAAHLTISKACVELPVEFTGSSFVVNQFAAGGVTSTPAAVQLIDMKRKQSEFDGNTYLKDLVDYLNKNASAEKYSSYFSSDNYKAPEDGEAGVFKNDDPSKKIYFA